MGDGGEAAAERIGRASEGNAEVGGGAEEGAGSDGGAVPLGEAFDEVVGVGLTLHPRKGDRRAGGDALEVRAALEEFGREAGVDLEKRPGPGRKAVQTPEGEYGKAVGRYRSPDVHHVAG